MDDELKHPLAKCIGCPLRGQPFVASTLVDQPEAVFVGEAPGAEEAKEGVPFVGQSGKLLRAVISKAGGTPANCNFINTVACRPPNNREPTEEEIKRCSGRFEYDITQAPVEAPIIIAGKTARHAILGDSGKMRGEWATAFGRRVMSTWHPAYVLRRPGEMNNLLSDVTRALNEKDGSDMLANISLRIIGEEHSLAMLVDTLVSKGHPIVVDIETDQLQDYETRDGADADKILCVAIAINEEIAYVIPAELIYENPTCKHLLKKLFMSVPIIAHNGKFDARFIWFQWNILMSISFDTMLAHYVLDENKGTHGLKALATQYFGIPDYEEEHVQKYLKSRNDRYSKVPFGELSRYAAYDVCITYALHNLLRQRLIKGGLYTRPFLNTIMPAANALLAVEINGIKIDSAELESWHEELQKEMVEISEQINSAAGRDINPNSPKQLATLLYDDLRMPQPTGRKMKPRSTNVDALSQLKGKHPIIDLLRRNRRVAKIDSSYVTNLLEYADTKDRVHCTFMIHGTETGRLSARNPALQTIPRESDELGLKIRKSFVAEEGDVLVIADYSQAELRVLAAMSGEPFLLKVYEEGRDLHTEAAIALFGEKFTKEQRVWCKMLNFSYAYGGNEFSFAEGTGMPIEAAREIVRKYDNNMPTAKAWKASQFDFARRRGYVESRFGRRRRFPLITRENMDDVRKASVNMPVQSGASDITLTALTSLVNTLSVARVVLTVHDSIVLECPAEVSGYVAETVKGKMEAMGSLFFPEVKWKADVEIKKRWGDK